MIIFITEGGYLYRLPTPLNDNYVLNKPTSKGITIMKIDTKEIREGGRIGEKVWICDYRRPDLYKKPIRNITPTLCVICSNDDLPKNKTVYYSETHFRPVSAKGVVLKKIISPVDNTGFRSYSGVELSVFDSEEECKKHFVKQCFSVAGKLRDLIENNPLIHQLKDLEESYRKFM